MLPAMENLTKRLLSTMAQTKRLKLCINIPLIGLMLFLSFSLPAQTKIDNLAIDYLVKNNEIKESDVVFKKITKTRKKTSIIESNVYNNEVFCMTNEDETLRIYGFGTYSSHSNRCMLFHYSFLDNHKYTYLGLGRIDEELVLLSSLLTSSKHKIPDKYQQEILEIYLGYRQGIIEVPVFLHCHK